MKILGIGVDIVKNSRIKKSINKNRFLEKIYSSKEIEDSKKKKNKVAFFSKRFAAKEAFSKALGTGFTNGLKFKDISVFNKKAKLIHRIQFPAKNITNCAFGGKNTKELYVSTATKGMSKGDLRKFRYSGFFFSVKTNSKGVLQKKFIISNEEKRSLL